MDEQSVSIKINTEGKNMLVAYLLWWFLGWAGVHRFYLGHVKSGMTQLLLFMLGWIIIIISTIDFNLIFFGIVGYALIIAWLIWWTLDAYFTYKIVVEENASLGVKNSTLLLSKSGGIFNELDQLEKLHALFEKGVITKEQYEAKKATLI